MTAAIGRPPSIAEARAAWLAEAVFAYDAETECWHVTTWQALQLWDEARNLAADMERAGSRFWVGDAFQQEIWHWRLQEATPQAPASLEERE